MVRGQIFMMMDLIQCSLQIMAIRVKNSDLKDKALGIAKQHYIPGQIWHITHRCHKREFLLKFSKDRHRWSEWLF